MREPAFVFDAGTSKKVSAHKAGLAELVAKDLDIFDVKADAAAATAAQLIAAEQQ